ncbi:unnamed protein product [Lampetra fluviatilis]
MLMFMQRTRGVVSRDHHAKAAAVVIPAWKRRPSAPSRPPPVEAFRQQCGVSEQLQCCPFACVGTEAVVTLVRARDR